ncbi:hypothetical protein ACHAPC_002471 [Botrytis cinerea]
MAELIKNANGPADKITSPEKPAKEAPRLTIKDVAALGFDNELIRFAILQTDGCIWNAVDVLLRLIFISIKFRSGALIQSEMSQSTRPAESIEDSKFGAAQEKSSGEGIRVEANVKSHTIEKDTLTLITFTRWLRFSKLCGNEACRRPSRFIEEDLETVASRKACQAKRKLVLNHAIPMDKCLTQHSPKCMRHLTISTNKERFCSYSEEFVMKLAFGEKKAIL